MVEIRDVSEMGPASFRWPTGVEQFTHGWEGRATDGARDRRFRHLLGSRTVYGRRRVHSVTFLDGAPIVEGVEADDYAESRALLSVLRTGGRAHVRQRHEVPDEYAAHEIVRHDEEIVARYSPRSLATRIREDDLERWLEHAFVRLRDKARDSGSRPPRNPGRPDVVIVGCVARKSDRPLPARELYTSALFAGRRAHAEASGAPWFVMSARHGLVAPEDIVAPYDVSMGDLSAAERRELGERVVTTLERRLGQLAGRRVELHAGALYVAAVREPLGRRGAGLVVPLRGLRIGEQLRWYVEHYGSRPTGVVAGVAGLMASEFLDGTLDLSGRPGAPAPGWDSMPEAVAVRSLRALGWDDAGVRRFLTFTAVMDRSRDADRLWSSALSLARAAAWAFDPESVRSRSFTALADVLRFFGVSQRHGQDAAAWRTIAEALTEPAAAPAIRDAVYDGVGHAPTLLEQLRTTSAAGLPRFPLLQGPKVGPMWVRMLAWPGNAQIEAIECLPVAVDVQVRKVTEYLGIADTAALDLDAARPLIQQAWRREVAASRVAGPPALAGTCSALDPVLWFWGKWGCTRCERSARRLPIAEVCARCRLPSTDSVA